MSDTSLLVEGRPIGLCPVVLLVAVYTSDNVAAEAVAARFAGHLPARVPVVQVRYGDAQTPGAHASDAQPAGAPNPEAHGCGARSSGGRLSGASTSGVRPVGVVFRVLPTGEWTMPDLAGGAAVALLVSGLSLDPPTREQVAHNWDHDEAMAAGVGPHTGPGRWRAATTELDREAALTDLWDALTTAAGPLPARRVGELIAACHYRDTVWLRDAVMGRAAGEYATVADHLAQTVRSAPRGMKAGIAAVAAMAAYAAGHQAQGQFAYAQAHGDDPDHALTALLTQAIEAGAPMTAIISATLDQLTESACLTTGLPAVTQ